MSRKTRRPVRAPSQAHRASWTLGAADAVPPTIRNEEDLDRASQEQLRQRGAWVLPESIEARWLLEFGTPIRPARPGEEISASITDAFGVKYIADDVAEQ